MKRLAVLALVTALPAAANVVRHSARPATTRSAPADVFIEPDLLATKSASSSRKLNFEQFAPMIDGVTVLNLAHDAARSQRVVLKPEFKGGPGAAFAVNF
jgi:hypothetical protein